MGYKPKSLGIDIVQSLFLLVWALVHDWFRQTPFLYYAYFSLNVIYLRNLILFIHDSGVYILDSPPPFFWVLFLSKNFFWGVILPQSIPTFHYYCRFSPLSPLFLSPFLLFFALFKIFSPGRGKGGDLKIYTPVMIFFFSNQGKHLTKWATSQWAVALLDDPLHTCKLHLPAVLSHYTCARLPNSISATRHQVVLRLTEMWRSRLFIQFVLKI